MSQSHRVEAGIEIQDVGTSLKLFTTTKLYPFPNCGFVIFTTQVHYGSWGKSNTTGRIKELCRSVDTPIGSAQCLLVLCSYPKDGEWSIYIYKSHSAY